MSKVSAFCDWVTIAMGPVAFLFVWKVDANDIGWLQLFAAILLVGAILTAIKDRAIQATEQRR